MLNIKFSYIYRDSGNYKNFGSVVFNWDEQINIENLADLIRSKLIDGIWFYASQWHVPDLHFSTWDDEIDHTFHEFEMLEYTEENPDALLSLSAFAELVKQTDWE